MAKEYIAKVAHHMQMKFMINSLDVFIGDFVNCLFSQLPIVVVSICPADDVGGGVEVCVCKWFEDIAN